ncbi:E3 ubiquitin-protein ligase RNF14-like [Onychostoma macrolepis]|uniref:E3 ubiquitin-protein ligase RNF14-like n=1 Tax=Onychostoma macrolepis TaxID=369639 RepID=UPI00272A16AA|nr:E3 ubiquitin-protein ligase RNF14-like [Onychostoma macrolepis]
MLKDAAEKELLEKKCKENEKQLIQRATDEKLSEDWLKENCKQCPSCGANIQKLQGCNKMTCSSCKQYFCWLCLAVLSRMDPYNHFKDFSSSCYGQHQHLRITGYSSCSSITLKITVKTG